jgi:hypothetical protein
MESIAFRLLLKYECYHHTIRFHYKRHKVFAFILHTTQVTQAMNLSKIQPKIIFNIGGDHLTLSMAVVLSIHALHFQRAMSVRKQRR